MPIYEYECTECGEKFELLRKLTDKDSEIKCPKCNKTAAKRVLSLFATSSPDNSSSLGASGSSTCGPT